MCSLPGPDYQATCVKKEDAALGSDVDSPTVPEEDAAPSCASFGCSEKYVANHPCQWLNESSAKGGEALLF